MPTMTTLVDGTVPVAADFNNNFTALNQAIGTGTSITTYTTGDILYAGSSNTLVKLPIGATGAFLVVSGGLPSWGGSVAQTLEVLFGDSGTGANTTETTLKSFVIPGGTLGTDGDTIRFRVTGRTAANANTKTFRLKYGATTHSTYTGALNADIVVWEGTITRTGAATQRIVTTLQTNSTVLGDRNISQTSSTTETLSGDVTLEVTGQNGTASANDIICDGFWVEKIRVV